MRNLSTISGVQWVSPGQAIVNWTFNKAWSCWLLKELVEAAAFRCSRSDMSALASWYRGVKNYDKPVIIIIDDLERCSGDVLGELVMTLRYNCTVEFFCCPFLVGEREVPIRHGKSKETLKFDKIDRSSSRCKNADIIVFNTRHWWT
ncbi:hypothetical protein ACQ4PT_037192 [Festuca glaucescens]